MALITTPTVAALPTRVRRTDVAALVCAVSAGTHAALVVPHLRESVPLAVAFAFATTALALAALAQAVAPSALGARVVATLLLALALAYVLSGRAYVGAGERPVADHDLVLFGPGDSLTLRAADGAERLEVLLLGGLPIREPVVQYGPFVMNTKAEILEAVDDFNAGRLGTIPATIL